MIGRDDECTSALVAPARLNLCLLRAGCEKRGPEDPVTIFHAHFDETGTHARDGIVRVAGFMAPYSFWPIFNQKWCDILNTKPPLRYWHTHSARLEQLATSSAPSRLLTASEIHEKEMRFAALARDHMHCMVGICVEVDAGAFRARLDGRLRPHKKFEAIGVHHRFFASPTFAAMREAVRVSVSIAHTWNKAFRASPLSVWTAFENNEGEDQQQFELTVFVQMLRRMATEATRKAIGPCVFVPGKGELGFTTIEAADLYAWHLRNGPPSGEGDVHPAWLHGLGYVPLHRRTLDIDDFDAMIDAINTGDRFDAI